jgi:hypothetical protein
MGNGGSMSQKSTHGGKIIACPHHRYLGSGGGVTSEVYDTAGLVKPSRVLQHIRIKRANVPKKYITFE